MSHDVFISHSTLDKLAADAICHGLEAKGIRCWIAPRDQVAGRPYGEQITSAIEEAQVMVLVFSDHVNQSQPVINEINLAAGANVTIVPFRIAGVEFGPELHYYLGRVHWLDAFPQPVDTYIDALADTVRRNLKAPAPAAAAAAAATVAPAELSPPRPSPPPAPPPPAPPPPAPPPPLVASTVAGGPGVGAGAGLAAGSGAAGVPPKTDMRPLMIAGGAFGVVAFIVLVLAIMPHTPPTPGPLQPANTIVPTPPTVPTTPPNTGPPPPPMQESGNATPAPTPNTDDNAPPVGNGQETTATGAADPGSVTQYETEVTPGGPPATMQGATVLSTQQLIQVMQARDAGKLSFWLIDARGCDGEVSIPTAVCFLNNSIEGLEAGIPDKSANLVVFCHDGSCPTSYQAGSAAVQAGYQHVYWYRGGINAWQASGLPTTPSAQTGPSGGAAD